MNLRKDYRRTSERPTNTLQLSKGGRSRHEPTTPPPLPPIREASGAPPPLCPAHRRGLARSGPLERTTNTDAKRVKEPHNEATCSRRPSPRSSASVSRRRRFINTNDTRVPLVEPSFIKS